MPRRIHSFVRKTAHRKKNGSETYPVSTTSSTKRQRARLTNLLENSSLSAAAHTIHQLNGTAFYESLVRK